jgi:putative copper resistance protein D
MIAFVAAIVLLKGILSRPPHVPLGALAAMVVPAGLFASLLVVPAHPTTYLSSPVGYTTTAVAAGAALYASSCSECHGRDGHGDGPAAGSLTRRPPDLFEQLPDRREGDLFWSIAHGIPGTPMPGFAPRLTEIEIWNLIQFLDAQSVARNANAMTDRVKPLRPVPAPDFTYELVGRPQETLLASGGNRVTLLVLYTLPQSLPRLADIATMLRYYANAGARVIAVPMDGVPAADAVETVAGPESIAATAGPDVAAAYALFAQPGTGPLETPPAHVEYLIDRQGQLRVRWIGVPDSSSDRTKETLAQIGALFREPPRPPPQWGHRH